jgi:hypothetical protein
MNWIDGIREWIARKVPAESPFVVKTSAPFEAALREPQGPEPSRRTHGPVGDPEALEGSKVEGLVFISKGTPHRSRWNTIVTSRTFAGPFEKSCESCKSCQEGFPD